MLATLVAARRAAAEGGAALVGRAAAPADVAVTEGEAAEGKEGPAQPAVARDETLE